MGAQTRAGDNAPNQIHGGGGKSAFGITSLISLSRAICSRAHSASLFSHISLASSLDKHERNKRGSTPSPKADGREGTRRRRALGKRTHTSFPTRLKDTAVVF